MPAPLVLALASLATLALAAGDGGGGGGGADGSAGGGRTSEAEAHIPGLPDEVVPPVDYDLAVRRKKVMPPVDHNLAVERYKVMPPVEHNLAVGRNKGNRALSLAQRSRNAARSRRGLNVHGSELVKEVCDHDLTYYIDRKSGIDVKELKECANALKALSEKAFNERSASQTSNDEYRKTWEWDKQYMRKVLGMLQTYDTEVVRDHNDVAKTLREKLAIVTKHVQNIKSAKVLSATEAVTPKTDTSQAADSESAVPAPLADTAGKRKPLAELPILRRNRTVGTLAGGKVGPTSGRRASIA